MLYFNGIHMIDLARFFGGDIECLTAYRGDGGRGNHALAVSGRFRNGGVVQINQNSGQSWEDCYEAVYASGTRAGLFIDGSKELEVMAEGRRFASGRGLCTFGFRARHTVSGNLAFWWAGGHYQRGYWGELSNFARAVLGLEPPGPTLEDGVQAHRLIAAILASAESGRQVVLP
jgi:predicted dehydrogenase